MKSFRFLFISILIILFILLSFSILGIKDRSGYLDNISINIDRTLKINGLFYSNIQYTNYSGVITNKYIINGINYEFYLDSLEEYIVTNSNIISNYSYDFKLSYYSKIFRNSDIYGVLVDTNSILNYYSFIKYISLGDNGSPFGSLISDKIISNKLDNIQYNLFFKLNYLYIIFIALLCLLIFYKVLNINKFIAYYKNNRLKIYYTLLICIIFISFILLLSFSYYAKKDRIGYISNFNLLEVQDNVYKYSFKIILPNRLLSNTNIYGVYPSFNNTPDYIESIEMDDIWGTHNGTLISSKFLNYYDIISDIPYYLLFKFNIFVYIVAIFFLFIILSSYFILKEYWVYKISLPLEEYLFVNKIALVSILLFIFDYWLFYPGQFTGGDTWVSIYNALFNKGDNANPIILEYSIRIVNNLGIRNSTLIVINLLLWHIGMFAIVSSAYIYTKNKFTILFLASSFLLPILNFKVDYTKDYVFTLYTVCAYGLVFFTIINPIKSSIKQLIKFIAFSLLVIGMLHRHNGIVTIYPFFIYFTYDILKNKIVMFSKKYNICFLLLMFINAILLISIFYFFPRIFIKKTVEYTSHNILNLQIAGTLVPNNDGSLIKDEWYFEGKTWEDVVSIYNKDPYLGDNFHRTLKIPKKYLATTLFKSILKYPKSYLNHMYKYTKEIYTRKFVPFQFGGYLNEFMINHFGLDIEEFKETKYVRENSGLEMTDTKKKVYKFILKVVPNINALFFILLSFILFIITIFMIFRKKYINNDILIFTFSTSSSAFFTAVIVALYTPAVRCYRYIYPIIPISIISLISFIVLLYYIGFIDKIKKLIFKK